MTDPYITVPIDTDEDFLYDDAVATLQALVPGWEPAEGNLDAWLLRAAARLASEIRDVAAEVPSAIFREYGRRIFNLPASEPSAATVASTWTARDSLGHTIPAGTTVTIRDATGALLAFRTVEAAVIPASSTTVAGVILEAVTPGAASSGLTADPELVDALDYIATVELDEPATSGGADGETDDEYLSRLSALLELQSDVPILPADFELLALTVTGVARALAADTYDPAALTTLASQTFDSDAAGVSATAAFWHAAATSATRVTTAPYAGAGHLSIVTPGSAANEGADWSPAGTYEAGRTYRVTGRVRLSTGTATLRAVWGTNSATDAKQLSIAATNAYQAFSIDWTPIADTASPRFQIATTGPASAQTIYVDELKVEKVGTTGNERTVTVYLADDAGQPAGSGVKADVDALLQGRREVNFVVNVADPAYRTIDVTFTAKALSGYTLADVQAAAEAAVTEYLDPARWGVQTVQGDPPWGELSHVRYLEVAAVLNSVEGVNYVSSLTVNGGTSDIALPLPAGLPTAGTIAGTVN